MTMQLNPSQMIVQALRAGNRHQIRTSVVAALAANAALGTGWRSIAEPLLRLGEFTLARRAMERYVADVDGTPAAMLDLASVLARSARAEEALAILGTIDRRQLDPAAIQYLRGTLTLNLGRLDEARVALKAALQLRPSSGQIAYALAKAGDATAATMIIDGARHLGTVPALERGIYQYAVGKVFEDQRAHKQACAAYGEAARLIASTRPYVLADDRASASQAVRGWTAETIAALSTRSDPATHQSIIVTGMPRSGTTLIEQVLVGHPDVADGDEVGAFVHIVSDVGGADAASYQRYRAGTQDRAASQEYRRLLSERFPGANRIVDKTLEANRYLGLLAAVMPDAPIIWVRREPVARAWSCFTNYFMAGLSWSYDLHALAQHSHLEDQLLDRWQSVLGDRLKLVDYEYFVADPVTLTDQLLDHCGLDKGKRLTSPEDAGRLVRTASAAQVRAPITSDRVQLAEAYRDFLAPFTQEYQRLSSAATS